MLRLESVVKDYKTGDNTVRALNGVSLEFRRNEFVSVLGASGCGKTTLLNIVGGLDRYTSGKLLIDNQATDTFKSVDWDLYRNQRIGFIFQSYNLIPQISILANVELALTLSGVPAKERRQRAVAALEEVGLGKDIKKRPNQLSGGQMQRVSIARALINNPEIILADEPTGALDSVTSVNVMNLLKEIAKNKLVIMVTHNPELAEQYSTRIIRMKDGEVIEDSAPYDSSAEVEDSAAQSAAAAECAAEDIMYIIHISE
ncbi:MAG: ABC transporter ATP-binding protein, partial [Clostridia bacterium]|nr:ABC transporter ATP-binding protein [Clostridia bacterium]